MKDKIELELEGTIKNLFGVDLKVELNRRPVNPFGDYATNVALQLAGQLNKPSNEIAELIEEKFKSDFVSKLTIDGPGFINLVLKDEVILKSANSATDFEKINQGKVILIEFGDPNPFKEMHLGHLYSSIVGDSIAKILESSGAKVVRLSYHGDVGLHVAKWIWAVGKATNWEIAKFKSLILDSDKDPLGYYYALGAQAFEKDQSVADEVRKINEHVYKKDRKDINDLYDYGIKISFEKFDQILKSIGISYDKRYLESQTSPVGVDVVKKHIGDVFEKSDGAVIYRGEKVGLHTRVFINSKGLPTYETKDLGLAVLKGQDYPKAERSIIITANEQTEYFKVMLVALSKIYPKLASLSTHIPHGFLNLSTGKMSSRTGNVYSANDLLKEVNNSVEAQYPDSNKKNDMYLAAVKYSFLKQRLGADIVFNVKESINLNGSSGPYLQYAHARACSMLAKVGSTNGDAEQVKLEESERQLAFKISEYSEVLTRSINDLLPSHICTYMFELAQTYNSFYESNRVVGHNRVQLRSQLVRDYAAVLRNGLGLLNISAPDTM